MRLAEESLIGGHSWERSLRFYRDGLGLATEGVIGQEFEYGAVVFFELQAKLRMVRWLAREPKAAVTPSAFERLYLATS